MNLALKISPTLPAALIYQSSESLDNLGRYMSQDLMDLQIPLKQKGREHPVLRSKPTFHYDGTRRRSQL